MRKQSVPGNVLKKRRIKDLPKNAKNFCCATIKGIRDFFGNMISNHSNIFQSLYKEAESTFKNKNDTIN